MTSKYLKRDEFMVLSFKEDIKQHEKYIDYLKKKTESERRDCDISLSNRIIAYDKKQLKRFEIK